MSSENITEEKKEMYFVINNSEGNTTIDVLTKEDLLGSLKESEYEKGRKLAFKNIPPRDTNKWHDDNFLIIKGEIVVPIVKVKYDIKIT